MGIALCIVLRIRPCPSQCYFYCHSSPCFIKRVELQMHITSNHPALFSTTEFKRPTPPHSLSAPFLFFLQRLASQMWFLSAARQTTPPLSPTPLARLHSFSTSAEAPQSSPACHYDLQCPPWLFSTAASATSARSFSALICDLASEALLCAAFCFAWAASTSFFCFSSLARQL